MPPRPSQPAHHDTSPAGCVLVTKILSGFNVPPADLAAYVGSSLVTIVRWSRGDLNPSPTVMPRLAEALSLLERGGRLKTNSSAAAPIFASRGARQRLHVPPLFRRDVPVELAPRPLAPIISRLRQSSLWGDGADVLASIFTDHIEPAPTIAQPSVGTVSAGKNTYTYDAHTYHTKVPPQGIAEVLRGHLPTGGLVLDPFAGSGMTGVAARALGFDAIP